LAGIGLVLLALLGTFAYLLVDSQSRVREESQKRFQTRAVISAALTESIFSSAGAQGQRDAAKKFGGPTVSKEALAKQLRESNQRYVVILDSKGKLLAASPGTPEYARRNLARKPTHVGRALKGRATLSGVISRKNQPDTIEFALPFKTRFGLRALVSAGRARPFARFLASYLGRARESETMEAFVVESNGRVIASAGSAGRPPKQLSPDLAGALRRAPQGTYGRHHTESYFAAAPVSGSDWRVVLSEPTSDLYPILAKGRTWVLWTAFAAFALLAIASLVLLRRVFRGADELRQANVALQERSHDLAFTNERLEQQTRVAQEASRAKSDFLANMSHELRTPLTAIIGYAELMASGAGGETEAERKKFLEVIVTNGRHLEGLIDGILDLAKVEAGKMEFRPEPIDVPELIGDLTTDMRVAAEKKQVELVTDVASEVRSVTTDGARLRQVVSNYLSNALKFTPAGGRIEVKVTPESSDAFRVVVVDNGIGIAPEDQEKLFRYFQQVDQTAQKEHQGTGLGLALVKRIVEAQGGRVGLQSEPGRGSAFYAVLPRSARKPSSPALPAENGKLDQVPVLR
jgi:signal transduction histidine kinase